jgi:predicted nucleic acid-binding protein
VIAVDASAAVHLLLATAPEGEWVVEQLVNEDVHIPYLLDVEVTNTLRRLVAGGTVASARARQALWALHRLKVVRHPHLPYLGRAWQLRRNLSAYDATYVALAEALEAPLVTTDRRLARAPGVRTTIVTP